MATILDAADALVSAINAATFTAPYASVTAERLYLPVWTPEQLESLKVSVVPSMTSLERLTRRDEQDEDTVDVGVQRRVGTAKTDLDHLVKLTVEIAKLCLRQTDAVAVTINPVFDPVMLESDRVFTSVITVTFRGLEAV